MTEKTGQLVGFLAVNESDDLFITCTSGVTIRTHVKNIREAGRATQGVKLINLDEGDEIAAIARIEDQEEDDIEDQIEATDEATNPSEGDSAESPKDDLNNESITDEDSETP